MRGSETNPHTESNSAFRIVRKLRSLAAPLDIRQPRHTDAGQKNTEFTPPFPDRNPKNSTAPS